jgi:hypothetical protein
MDLPGMNNWNENPSLQKGARIQCPQHGESSLAASPSDASTAHYELIIQQD